MSADRFDELTRALATGRSRRTVLKAIAATAAGGVLALLGGRSVEAKTCSGNCDCPPHALCEGGQCSRIVCSKGEKFCKTDAFGGLCIARGEPCNRFC